ncbi:hypothetical protein C0J52_20814 [Blattella germanica]|nr:hypothetical protein C0J52_20814 [Blattella germanica]
MTSLRRLLFQEISQVAAIAYQRHHRLSRHGEPRVQWIPASSGSCLRMRAGLLPHLQGSHHVQVLVFWGVNDFGTKQKILDLHNKYRSYVAQGKERRGAPGPQPPAANMNRLKWDDELSRVAQRWADQCDFKHDTCRNVDRFGWVGQNLYKEALWKSNGVDPDNVQHWDVAIKAFYEEVVDLNNKNIDKFNSYSSRNQTGHYTQLVWGKTLLVGCGFISYWEWRDGKDWYNKYYACNYAPGGNVIAQKVYEKGKACSKCPPDTICRDGLCTANFPMLISIVKNIFPNLYNLLRG